MQIRTAKDLGLMIRERRRPLQLGQQDLADRVGVSRKWTIDMEQGKPRARIDLVLRTMHALGLRIEVQTDTAEANVSLSARPGVDIDAVIDKARGRKS